MEAEPDLPRPPRKGSGWACVVGRSKRTNQRRLPPRGSSRVAGELQVAVEQMTGALRVSFPEANIPALYITLG